MTYRPEHFDLHEVVCPHIYYRWGDMAWQFFDYKILVLHDWLRDRLGPTFLNNWYYSYKDSDYIKYIAEMAGHNQPIVQADIPKVPSGNLLDERGIRCPLCSLVMAKTNAGIIYSSPHILAKAGDSDVQGRTAEECRQYLINKRSELPFPIRLEKNVSWLHMDCEDSGEKVQLINP